jgi:ABC-type sugar transport system ATPase subunit
MDNKKYILEAKGITKIFPGVKALDSVDFQLNKGEIHALVGENGAGKSTFSKILAGMYTPTEGEIFLNGQRVNIHHPLQAINLGIGMVHQERNLVPFFNAVENIYLNQEITSQSIFLRPDLMKKEVAQLMQKIGINFELDKPVSELGPSKQQMAEILRVLLLKPKIIIFDEPTSSLTKNETQIFFELLNNLKKDVAIIFISHRLDEVFEISDCITVLRDGKKINTVKTCQVNQEEVINMMVAREIKDLYPKTPVSIGGVVLEGRNISAGKLHDVSFKVHKGEIVGFSGMVGSGRTELAETIFGLRRLEAGEVIFKGKNIVPKSPRVMIKEGLYLIPEDRRVEGLNLQMNVKENLSVVHLEKVCSGMFVRKGQENKVAQDAVEKFDIRITNLQQIVGNLSGGNQQKVVIGKWLMEKAEVLIMDEATAGIDVGAKREIYKIMVKLAETGIGIIFISSDLPELIGMSDRIYVMNEGTITAEFPRERFSQQTILQYAIKDTNGK